MHSIQYFTSQPAYDIVLSPWIMAHFYPFAGIVLFAWFALIRLAYKVDFLRLDQRPGTRLIYWFTVVLISLALIGYLGFFAVNSNFNELHPVDSSLSPDGHKRATILRSSWVEIIYDLVVESNDPTPPFSQHIPLLAHGAGSASFGNNEPSQPPHIVWSNDSMIVSLWFGQSPQFAYDFSRDVVIDPAHEPATFSEMLSR
jgi:hypothetical protein